jgi:hypothetical protein
MLLLAQPATNIATIDIEAALERTVVRIVAPLLNSPRGLCIALTCTTIQGITFVWLRNSLVM